MPRLIIYPYNLGSNSARELQNVFATHRAKRVRPDGNYRPFRNHVILNLGNSVIPNWWAEAQRLGIRIINQPTAVEVASNKLLAFGTMKEAEVSIPEYTVDSTVAIEWVNSGCIVVARKLLRGSEGRGIVIIEKERGADNITTIESAPLYVKYIKKQAEYRIHIFDSEVIDVQEKKTRQDATDINYRVQSYNNGFIFAREGVTPPAQVLEEATKAVAALGLTYGACDLIFNSHYNKAYVLEINSAPGMCGQTIESYRTAILRFMNG